MQRRLENDNAEVGTSAMIIFIALVLVSSIISAIIVGIGGNVLSQSKNDAQQNIPSFKGMANVVVLEIASLGANDEIHIVFELPYVEHSVDEDALSWVIMCFPSGQTGRQTIHFDDGNFELATTLDGDGRSALPLEEFEPGIDCRMIIPLNECDLEDVDSATLVMIVDKGRTQEWVLNIGTAPYQGQDLN